MKKFNPSDEEIALIEILMKKVISLNVKNGLETDIIIGKYGIQLYANSEQGSSSWNNCSWAVTDEEFRSMFRWLCEKEEKTSEKTI